MIRNWFKIIVLALVCYGTTCGDVTPSFKRQVIKVASNAQFNRAWKYIFEELNGDDLVDLLVVSPSGDMFVYYQDRAGFSAAPAQGWNLPKDTMWLRVADVTEGSGAEIIVSTADGVKYYRQSDGAFEASPRMLVETKQVFAGASIRSISYLGKKRHWGEKVGSGIPVILADRVLVYESDERGRCKLSRTIELERKGEIWKWGRTNWSLGGKRADQVWMLHSATDKAEPNEAKAKTPEEENEYIKRMVEKIKGHELQGHYIITEDINGDDRKDVTLVHLMQNIDLKTNFMIFFRREDGKIGEEPDQILRCRGIPVKGDYPGPSEVSPFIDINKDGFLDVVLIELKDRLVSVRTFMKMLASRGVDWVLTVRLFKKKGGFNSRADFSMDITSVLPLSEQFMDLANFDGDFNADGRPDLVLRRSPTESYIYLSSVSSGFYNPKPQLKLDVPAEGRTSVKDLNGDGVSDVYLIDYGKGEITVFLSERSDKKGALQ